MKRGSSPSKGSQQWWTGRVESMKPAPHGRWMLGICSFIRVQAPGELDIHVFERKAWRAAVEAAVSEEGVGENKKLQKNQLVFKHSLGYFDKQHWSCFSDRILWMFAHHLFLNHERMSGFYLRAPLLICMMLRYVTGFHKRLAEWFRLCEAR